MTETDPRDDTILAAIRSEWWAPSDWNDARNTLGIPGRHRRNPQEGRPEYVVAASAHVAEKVVKFIAKKGSVWYSFMRADRPSDGEG